MSMPRAADWGKWLAHHLSAQGTKNPFLLATRFGWKVILENKDPVTPRRMAEWDGSCRIIRIFAPILCRHLGDSIGVLHRACAHELFHGLVAVNYRVLKLTATIIPSLTNREEETAAQIFSEALLNLPSEVKCPPSDSR